VTDAPQLPSCRTLLLGFVLGIVALGADECFWRLRGFRPSVSEDNHGRQLWRHWRERIHKRSGKVVVSLGASRIQSAFAPETFRERYPDHQFVQLAEYAGGSPFGTLKDLADDPSFQGIVICDVIAPFLLPARWADQRQLYESRALAKELYEKVPLWRLQDRLAILKRDLRPPTLLRTLRLPDPNLVRLRFDRSVELDFSVISDIDQLREPKIEMFRNRYARASERMTLDEFTSGFQEIDEWVKRIYGRGGKVVFLRCPSAGERKEIEDQYHPREGFWDRFAAHSSAECIHFEDVPSMLNLRSPDGSHLDMRERAGFTIALLDELDRRGVLSSGE